VRRVANLASRITLSLGMGVAEGLGDEQHRQSREGKGKHPNPIASLSVRYTHIDAYTLPHSSIGRQTCGEVRNTKPRSRVSVLPVA
jgi:hypothetical protein